MVPICFSKIKHKLLWNYSFIHNSTQDKNNFYDTPQSFDTLSLNRICLKFAFKLNLFSHEALWPLESQGVIEPIYESP